MGSVGLLISRLAGTISLNKVEEKLKEKEVT